MEIRTRISKNTLIKGLFLLSVALLITSNLINTTPYRADLEYVIIPVILCVCIALFLPKKLNNSIYACAVIMAVFTFISTVLSDVVHLRTGDIKFYIFIIAFIIISSVCLEKKDITFIINAYAYIVLIIACWLIITYVLGMNLSVQHRATLVVFGVEKDQNYTGAFFAPAASLFFYKFLYSNRKVQSMVCMLIMVVAVFITGSRAGLLTPILLAVMCILTPPPWISTMSSMTTMKRTWLPVFVRA